MRLVDEPLKRLPKGKVADAYGVDRGALYRWLENYSQYGSEGLRRKGGGGRPRLLSELNQDELLKIVLGSPIEAGFESDLWTVGRLHQIIAEKYCVDVSKITIGSKRLFGD